MSSASRRVWRRTEGMTSVCTDWRKRFEMDQPLNQELSVSHPNKQQTYLYIHTYIHTYISVVVLRLR